MKQFQQFLELAAINGLKQTWKPLWRENFEEGVGKINICKKEKTKLKYT